MPIFNPRTSTSQQILVFSYQALLVLSAGSLPWNPHLANALMIVAVTPSFLLWDRKFDGHPVLLPITLFVLLAISLFYSENLKEGISFFELKGNLVLIPLVFYLGRNYITKRVIKRAFWCFCIAVLIYSLYGYFIVTHDLHKLIVNRYELIPYDFHPGYLSMFFLWVIVLLFVEFKIHPIFILSGTALFVFFLIMLTSKNQVATFFILCFTFFVRQIFDKISWIKITSILIGLLLIGLAFSKNDFFKKRMLTEGEGQRINGFQACAHILKDNYLLGVGLGDFQDELNNYAKKHYPANIGFNAHNQFLNYWIAAGIVAALAYLALFIVPFFYGVNFTFFCFLLIVFFAALTESFFHRQIGLLFFLYFYSLFSVSPDRKNDWKIQQFFQ